MTDETKKCPYCAELINIDAVKCKHCGEFFNKQVEIKKTDINFDIKKHFKNTEIIAASVLIVSFFLPWINVLVSLSGYQLAQISQGLSSFNGSQNSSGSSASNLLYVIPILAIATIIAYVKNISSKEIIAIVSGSYPILLIAYVLYNDTNIGDIFSIATLGLYLTFLAAVTLIISPFRHIDWSVIF